MEEEEGRIKENKSVYNSMRKYLPEMLFIAFDASYQKVKTFLIIRISQLQITELNDIDISEVNSLVLNWIKQGNLRTCWNLTQTELNVTIRKYWTVNKMNWCLGTKHVIKHSWWKSPSLKRNIVLLVISSSSIGSSNCSVSSSISFWSILFIYIYLFYTFLEQL